MSQAILNHVSNSSIKKDVPVLRAGYVVRVHQRIKEGEKERIQIFEGLIIKMGPGARAVDKTFTVRKVVEGVGVEKVFPLHSPMIEKIEITKRGKVRRAKLYYMRTLQGKSTRLQDKKSSLIEMMFAPSKTEAAEPVEDDIVNEDVVAEDIAEEPVAEEMETTEKAVEEMESKLEDEDVKPEEK